MSLPKLSLADLARSGHITRWHSVRTSRDQTLAEHHYMVTRISNRLAKDIFGSDLNDSGLLQIMEYASLHDTPELLMGDLPSPLKRHIEQISEANNPIEAIEREVAPWLFEMKEEIQQLHPEYLAIIKLADLVDALLFIEHEGIGSHAREVAKGLQEQFQGKVAEAGRSYPKYPWQVAEQLLAELLQNEEQGVIAFEQRTAKK